MNIGSLVCLSDKRSFQKRPCPIFHVSTLRLSLFFGLRNAVYPWLEHELYLGKTPLNNKHVGRRLFGTTNDVDLTTPRKPWHLPGRMHGSVPAPSTFPVGWTARVINILSTRRTYRQMSPKQNKLHVGRLGRPIRRCHVSGGAVIPAVQCTPARCPPAARRPGRPRSGET